jgi:DNA invertase Pin-like site-specific DNA recombinase
VCPAYHPWRKGGVEKAAGDTVVVAAIDRLGRSVAEVTRTIAVLGDRTANRVARLT